MRLKENSGRDIAVPIGFKPYVFFPLNKKTITLFIRCITQHDLAEDARLLINFETSCYTCTQGSIGVRIEKISRGISAYLLWRTFVIDKIDPGKWAPGASAQVSQFISFLDVLNNFWKNSGVLPKFLLINRVYTFLNYRNARNTMIVWKDTTILPAFIGSTNVTMESTIDNKTDNTGHFNVKVTITNNMDVDIDAIVLVDLSQDPFKNTIVPMLKGITIYNVGSWKCSVRKHDKNSTTIFCSVPEAGFDLQAYTITVECAPYIFVNNSNLYGLYMFDIRWKITWKAHYTDSSDVTDYIQTMWYNIPIFYGEPGLQNQIFQTNRKVIIYRGNTTFDKILDTFTRSFFGHTYWLLLIIFLVVTPYILIMLRIYDFLRNKKKKRE